MFSGRFSLHPLSEYALWTLPKRNKQAKVKIVQVAICRTERHCALPVRLPDPSAVLDKNRALMGPEFVSSTETGVWRKALAHFQTPILHWINFNLRISADSVEFG